MKIISQALIYIFLVLSSPLFAEETYLASTEPPLYQRQFVKVDYTFLAPHGQSPVYEILLTDHVEWFIEAYPIGKNQALSHIDALSHGEEIFFETIPFTPEYRLLAKNSTWKALIQKDLKALLPVILEMTPFVWKAGWCSLFDEYAYSLHLSDGSSWIISDITTKQTQECLESWKKEDTVLVTRKVNTPNWDLLNMSAPYAEHLKGATVDRRSLESNTYKINLIRNPSTKN